jgi:tungstate transport system permease protein
VPNAIQKWLSRALHLEDVVLADILGGIIKAFELVFTGDPELYGIVYRSLFFSGAAIILAILWGTPFAMLIGLKEFRGKTIIKTMINTLIGLPTVVLGLILLLIFSRGGPLGFLGLLYTPGAIILGQAILVTPILVSIGVSAIESVDPEIMSLSKTLGASDSQSQVAVLREAFNGILLSDIASFNRAIGELGVVLLVGGNIAGGGLRTDVLTTAISRNTQIGEIGLAVALGIFLMIIVFTINIIVVLLRRVNYLVELAKAPYVRLKRYRENSDDSSR